MAHIWLKLLMKFSAEYEQTCMLGGVSVMIITAEELERNLDFYLDMASKEDIFIKVEGQITARLTSPEDSQDTIQ